MNLDLKVYPLATGEYQDYHYFVNTPDGGTFYFQEKELAEEFIEFYKEHKKKKLPALLK